MLPVAPACTANPTNRQTPPVKPTATHAAEPLITDSFIAGLSSRNSSAPPHDFADDHSSLAPSPHLDSGLLEF